MAQSDQSDSDTPGMEKEEAQNASHLSKPGENDAVTESEAAVEKGNDDSNEKELPKDSLESEVDGSISSAEGQLKDVLDPQDDSDSNAPTPEDQEFQKDVSDLLGQLDGDLQDLGKEEDSETLSSDSTQPEESTQPKSIEDIEIPADPIESDSDETAEGGLDENSGRVEDEGPAPNESETEKAPSLPSPEDLLKQASSVLNGDDAVDLDALSVEEEDVQTLPSPDALISQAGAESESGVGQKEGISEAENLESPSSENQENLTSTTAKNTEADAPSDIDESEEEEVMAMPDPQALIDAAATGKKVEAPEPEAIPAIDDSDDEPEPQAANVADRGGDLPPPPPAPVAIDDDDLEFPDPKSPSDDEGEGKPGSSDPFADDSLDGFNEPSDGADKEGGIEALSSDDSEEKGEEAFEIADPIEELKGLEALEDLVPIEDLEDVDVENSEAVVYKKPSLVHRILTSTTLAASLFFLGVAIVLANYKQEVVEFLYGQDFDASRLSYRIANISSQVLAGINENGNYEMQAVSSRIRRVGVDEIRINAVVAARLRKNLYLPVSDDLAMRKFKFDDAELIRWKAIQEKDFPGIIRAPERTWRLLYRRSAEKGETVSVNATYRLTREGRGSEWKLSEIRIKGVEDELVWPEGDPKESFGPLAYDLDSPKFASVFREHKTNALWYIEKVQQMSSEAQRTAAKIAELKRKNEERLIGALSEGAYFKGMAIVGDEGEDAREIFMVITDTDENGSLVKGVFKLNESEDHSKHFTGFLDFKHQDNGESEAMLKVTTVAFEGERSNETLPQFFNPGTVTRINLQTDGHRMEGDSNDVSLRLVRRL